MNILLSGGTGLVGKALVPLLQSQGHQVANLTTREELDGVWENGLRHSYWNPARMQIKASELDWAHGVINLAGYSVANRWTRENKNRMIASRIDSTELLVNTILKSPRPPKWFLSAGATGYYREQAA
jgi:NAD dependent epimerase/dehydratase family enzyme